MNSLFIRFFVFVSAITFLLYLTSGKSYAHKDYKAYDYYCEVSVSTEIPSGTILGSFLKFELVASKQLPDRNCIKYHFTSYPNGLIDTFKRGDIQIADPYDSMDELYLSITQRGFVDILNLLGANPKADMTEVGNYVVRLSSKGYNKQAQRYISRSTIIKNHAKDGNRYYIKFDCLGPTLETYRAGYSSCDAR